MSDGKKKRKVAPSQQGRFSRAMNSIRTQYSMATAFFLLVILAIFYIGGRIVLVHLVRDAEQQVKDVGLDVSRLAYRNADRIKSHHVSLVEPVARMLAEGRSAADVLSVESLQKVSLLIHCSPAGEFISAAQRRDGEVQELGADDMGLYADRIAAWTGNSADDGPSAAPVGIMRLSGVSHYVMLARCPTTGARIVLGSEFNLDDFSSQLSESYSAYDVRVKHTSVNNLPLEVRRGVVPAASVEKDSFGIAPMLSQALDFYSGGFWDLRGEPLEAVFAVRDIAGSAITTLAVSLPRTFSRVTGEALGRLTFFVAALGMIFVLPIFWIQAKVLLNPLTEMTEAIRKLGLMHADADCPRLEWDGKDEFALLAESVNRMLETISARTVSLGQLKVRQKALIDGIPDALAVFDSLARLVSVTKQPEGVPPLPGFRSGEQIDPEVYGAAGAAAFNAAVKGVFAGAGLERVELADIKSGVTPRPFDVRLTRMDDLFVLATIRDTTDEAEEHRLRVAAERRAMDTSKRESLLLLAAGIAHDMNNVLAVILNTVEVAAAAHAGDGAAIARINAIRDAVKRGSAMTRELMTYAGETRISLARMKPSLVVSDVQMLAEGVVGKNIDIVYELADDAPDIDADPNQFWKVLFNIIKNAAEAIGTRPGHIVVSTSRFRMTPAGAAEFKSEHPLQPGEGVLIRSADGGPGVPPDLLPRLFDPYVSSKSIGRGLGLATVRTIVEAHGGGIRVASVVDKGTVFTVYLPASNLPDSSAPQHSRDAKELPAEVLVVDNDEAILKTCSILLRSLGVVPRVARDRREALAVLRRLGDAVGVVLLDANLGGVDTVRLLEACRIAAPRTRVVVSSGSREDDIRKLFAAHPYDGFLAKPYTIAELKEKLSGGTGESGFTDV